MEILSKLWVAMTTQNENLIMVFSIFLSLIEIPLTMEFFLKCLKNTNICKAEVFISCNNCTYRIG